MKKTELAQETQFGLDNLGRLHKRIEHIVSLELDEQVLVSALAYEGLGYYNAIEHLMLRFIKYLNLPKPKGASSHKDTLRTFKRLSQAYNISCEEEVWQTIRELMAFRHVMTKIYGFLIDLEKLESIIGKIRSKHTEFVQLFLDCLQEVD